MQENEQRKDIREVHLSRLSGYLNQWRLDDLKALGVGGDYTASRAKAVIDETVAHGRLMRQMNRLQGGLSSTRQKTIEWLSKPSVQLPAFGIGAAAAFFTLNTQLSIEDVSYMRDMAVITELEFESLYASSKNALDKSREVAGAVAGLGAATSLALNMDRLLALATGKHGHLRRLEDGADMNGDRLLSRLSEAERSVAQEIITSFSKLDFTGLDGRHREVIGSLIDNIDRSERLVAGGLASADSVLNRLSVFRDKIVSVQQYMEQLAPREASRATMQSTPQLG